MSLHFLANRLFSPAMASGTIQPYSIDEVKGEEYRSRGGVSMWWSCLANSSEFHV